MKKIVFKDKNNPVFCSIIAKTILTEKTTSLELNNNCISFITPKWANKQLIRLAIEALFSVKVYSVRVVNTPGKTKMIKGRQSVKKSAYKKVYVTVDSLENAGEIFKDES